MKMKNLVFIGDSITDAKRDRSAESQLPFSYGSGYVFFVAGELASKYPQEYCVLNKGVGGNNVTELYARMKTDCWLNKPDVVTITMGINDVCFEAYTKNPNGVELDRFERMYRNLIEDTFKYCGKIPMILIRPFILSCRKDDSLFDEFLVEVKEYSKIVEKLSVEYGLQSIDLQGDFEELARKCGEEHVLYDGTHPNIAGSKLIADKWLKVFEERIMNSF